MSEIDNFVCLISSSECLGQQLFNILQFQFVLFYDLSVGNHNCEFIRSQWTVLHLVYLHGVIYFSKKMASTNIIFRLLLQALSPLTKCLSIKSCL